MDNMQLTLKLAKKKIGIMLLMGVLAGALAFAAFVMSQKSFQADLEMLVVQNCSEIADQCGSPDSIKKATRVLARAIKSDRFLAEVNGTNMVAKGQSVEDWKKTVEVEKDSKIGTLEISVFENSQKRALEIAQAIFEVLMDKNAVFLGENRNINIIILNDPVSRKNPSVFDMLLVALGGFAGWVVLCMVWIGYQARWGKYRNIFPMDEDGQETLEYWSRQDKN